MKFKIKFQEFHFLANPFLFTFKNTKSIKLAEEINGLMFHFNPNSAGWEQNSQTASVLFSPKMRVSKCVCGVCERVCVCEREIPFVSLSIDDVTPVKRNVFTTMMMTRQKLIYSQNHQIRKIHSENDFEGVSEMVWLKGQSGCRYFEILDENLFYNVVFPCYNK